MKVVIIGGGPAGFSAAMVARSAGAEVTLVERTDLLGGLGLVAGIGILSARGYAHDVINQERVLGGAAFFDLIESIATHKHINPPGYKDVLLYNVTKLNTRMQKALIEGGVQVILCKKAADIEMSGNRVTAVVLADGSKVNGDAFIDATGAVPGMSACEEHAFGCVQCIYRCPTFGDPGGIVEKRAKTVDRTGRDGKPGVIGTSVLVPIASLSAELQKEVTTRGFASIPVPPNVVPDTVRYGRAGAATTSMMDQEVTRQNLLILDIGGFVKVTATGSPLYARSLRKFPGLEDSMIMQPTAGARGHILMGMAMALRDNSLKVDGFENLFSGGAKAHPSASLLEAVISGDLAGNNAARTAAGLKCLELPVTLAAGAYFAYTNKIMHAGEQPYRGYKSVSQEEFQRDFNVLREGDAVTAEVDKAGLRGSYSTRMC